jgi:predicted transcriptional regulator
MVELDPESIGIVMILPDGTTGTVYYNADRRDMAIMRQAIEDDSLADFLRMNADIIAKILSGEEDEEDGLCEPDTEADSEG